MSIVVDGYSREPVVRDVLTADLAGAIAVAQSRIETGEYRHPAWKTGALLVQRSDQTVEARRAAWESEFYDRDKNGRRLRRYKKPAIERDWEAWVKAERKAAVAAAKAENDQYDQRRRDGLS